MKQQKDGYLREREHALRQHKIWMLLKSLIPALPFLFLLVFFAAMWLVEWTMAPQYWLADEVRFARMGEVKYIGSSRFGGTDDGPALMTTDGRTFTCSEEEAAVLEEKLRGGDQCSIMYVHTISGYENLEALTANGEVLIDGADSERKWHEDVRELGALALGDLLFGILAAAAGYFFWGRKECQEIHRLQQEMAVRQKKNETRAARRKERQA